MERRSVLQSYMNINYEQQCGTRAYKKRGKQHVPSHRGTLKGKKDKTRQERKGDSNATADCDDGARVKMRCKSTSISMTAEVFGSRSCASHADDTRGKQNAAVARRRPVRGY